MLARDPRRQWATPSTALLAAVVAAVAGFAAVYVTLGRPDNADRQTRQAAPKGEAPRGAVPQGPGLGVTPDLDVIARYRLGDAVVIGG